MSTETLNISPISGDASTELGDSRRTRRLAYILEKMSASSQKSLPEIFESRGELEGAYRFFSNHHFSWRDIEAGSSAMALERSKVAGDVLIAHDSTDISFKVHDPDYMRQNLVLMSSKTQGFLWHAAFAISDTDTPYPLGLVASQPYVHRTHLCDDETENFWRLQGGVYENESQRWFDVLDRAEERFGDCDLRPIHLMDREADSFTLLNYLQRNEKRFVIRVKTTDRKLADADLSLSGVLKQATFMCRRKVRLGFRTPFRNVQARKKHPERKPRSAVLEMRAAQVTISRGRMKDLGYSPEGEKIPKTLTLNVVEAVEVDPPAGKRGVRWLLWTSEPIESAADIERVVDAYRRRWIIEEFFKGIKTGCKQEERQLESASGLLKMLVTSSIVSWWLLALRAIATDAPDTSWRVVLSALAFRILRQTKRGKHLTEAATANDVFFVIAGLGGHLKHNGAPGWQTLMKGMRALTGMVEGARLFAASIGLDAEVDNGPPRARVRSASSGSGMPRFDEPTSRCVES